jgi:hypothetical protein
VADTSVKVSFIGDAKKLKSTIDGVDKDIEGLGKSSKSFGNKFSSGLSKTLPVLAGVGAGVAVLGSALKAAVEDEAEQRTLAETLRNVAGATDAQIVATEKWIDVTQRATGVADSDLRPALDKLVRSSSSVEEAQKNLGIAMDVSRGTGKDLDTVATALAKVLEGNTAAATKLVPELTGIAREGASADEVMSTLATTFKDQTTVHAGTAEGKMDRLNIAFAEMKEKLGEKLMPKLIGLTDWLIEKAIPWIEDVGTKVATWWEKQDGLRDAIEKGAKIFEALIEDVKAFVGWVDAAVTGVDNLAKKIKEMPDSIFGLRTGLGDQSLGAGDVGQLRAKGLSDKEIKAILGDKIGEIGTFGSGGVVGGPRGSAQLIMAHGGETVLPTHKNGAGFGGPGIVIENLVVSAYDPRQAARIVMEEIRRIQRGAA